MKRFEGESSRQKAYNKKKDRIVRKAQELTILCETDLALLMFSPDGQLTSFGSNGRVEDTFIRFLESDEYKRGPIQNAEQLTQKLRELKNEAEVQQKMATVEALQEKLAKINRRTEEVRAKLRFYNPDVEKINSVAEAEMHEQFLVRAIENIKRSKEKLFREQVVGPVTESQEGKFLGEQIVQQDKLLGKQIVLQDTGGQEDNLLGEQIVPQEIEIDENKFGKQILQQDGDYYKEKWLGKQIMGQGTSTYELQPLKQNKFGKQILQQDSDYYKEKLLGKQIMGQGTSTYKVHPLEQRVADDLKCPVPFADQYANTIKRRPGRPRKNQSPHMNTNLSNDLIQAQKGWNMQGGQHSSMINRQILQQVTSSCEGNFLGEQIVQQDARSYEDKLLGKHIMLQDTESHEEKWLGKQIMGQGTSTYERVADHVNCPVPFADQSANIIKRGNNLIQAQKSWNMQGVQHSSMISKQILQQGTTRDERVANDMKSPVPIIDQSENTNKRRRGRPRKNRSPHKIPTSATT